MKNKLIAEVFFFVIISAYNIYALIHSIIKGDISYWAIAGVIGVVLYFFEFRARLLSNKHLFEKPN